MPLTRTEQSELSKLDAKIFRAETREQDLGIPEERPDPAQVGEVPLPDIKSLRAAAVGGLESTLADLPRIIPPFEKFRERIREERPTAFGAGRVAGTIGSFLLPFGAGNLAFKAAGKLAKPIETAFQGAPALGRVLSGGVRGSGAAGIEQTAREISVGTPVGEAGLKIFEQAAGGGLIDSLISGFFPPVAGAIAKKAFRKSIPESRKAIERSEEIALAKNQVLDTNIPARERTVLRRVAKQNNPEVTQTVLDEGITANSRPAFKLAARRRESTISRELDRRIREADKAAPPVTGSQLKDRVMKDTAELRQNADAAGDVGFNTSLESKLDDIFKDTTIRRDNLVQQKSFITDKISELEESIGIAAESGLSTKTASGQLLRQEKTLNEVNKNLAAIPKGTEFSVSQMQKLKKNIGRQLEAKGGRRGDKIILEPSDIASQGASTAQREVLRTLRREIEKLVPEARGLNKRIGALKESRRNLDDFNSKDLMRFVDEARFGGTGLGFLLAGQSFDVPGATAIGVGALGLGATSLALQSPAIGTRLGVGLNRMSQERFPELVRLILASRARQQELGEAK